MKFQIAAILSLAIAGPLHRLDAQENYEIQVYESETASRGKTVFELHSNFTGRGRTLPLRGMVPTDGAFHETLEITHGISDIFEVGVYLFTSVRTGEGWQVAGAHIRPRIRAPESWKLPVGLGLSTELGPTSAKFDENEFGVELRPIIDQTIGRLYWAVNPTIGWSLKGPDAGTGIRGTTFNPSAKLGWQFTKKLQAGVEYYGGTGSLARVAPSDEQSHLLYPTIDLTFSPEWEFNLGYGVLISGAGDQNILKMIVGRRFAW